MRRPQTDRDLIAMREELEKDVATALQLSPSAVGVRDVYGLGMYMVLDLKAAVQGEDGTTATKADLLAEQLCLLLQNLGSRSSGGLRKGATSRELDPSAGVQLLTSDGRTTPIHVSREAELRFARLERFSLMDLFPINDLSGPALFTFQVASIALLAGCVYTCFRQFQMNPMQARSQTSVLSMGGYGRVARDDDLAAAIDSPTVQ